MITHLKQYKRKYFEIVFGTLLFSFALFIKAQQVDNYQMSMAVFVGLILYYLVFLELIRTIVEFIIEDRIKIKYIIDGSILFTLREILVATSINHHHIETELTYVGLMTGLMILLFIFRYIDIHFNLREKKCFNTD